jgi:hypothetical protein
MGLMSHMGLMGKLSGANWKIANGGPFLTILK